MLIPFRSSSFFALAMGAAVSGCTIPTGADAGLTAYVGILPSMREEATEIYRTIDDFGLHVNNVRVALTRADGSFLYDSTVAIMPGEDSIVLELQVHIASGRELVSATVELRDSAVVMFSGAENVELRRGGPTSRTPLILLDYTGPGALARHIDMNPRDTTIAMRSEIAFTAAARNASGAALGSVPISWSLSDPTAGDIGSDGVFRPRGRGETWVIARLPTGLRDSSRVAIGKR